MAPDTTAPGTTLVLSPGHMTTDDDSYYNFATHLDSDPLEENTFEDIFKVDSFQSQMMTNQTQLCPADTDIFYDAVSVLQEGDEDGCSPNVDEDAVPSCRSALVSTALFINMYLPSFLLSHFIFPSGKIC